MIDKRQVNFDSEIDWNNIFKNSSTGTFFQTKEWLGLWKKYWGGGGKEEIYAVFENESLVGIAPFYIDGKYITIMGVPSPSSPGSLSDFGDIITRNLYEEKVWRIVLDEIRGKYPRYKLELNFIREESASLPILQKLGGKTELMEVSPIINLPAAWDDYLATFNRHERHEIRRKMRKNDETGTVFISNEINKDNIQDFFKMMSDSDKNKMKFLTEDTKNFFTDLITGFGGGNLISLNLLKYNDRNIAGLITINWKDEILLYNSGFDMQFAYLSPGLILNILVIKRSIEEGRKKFDFLRGGEKYKYGLGARERKLYKVTF